MRNRVLVTAHTTCYVDANGHPDARDVAYFAARAAGGAALVTTGTVAVHPSSPLPYGVYANFDDSAIAPFRALSEAVHAHGALVLPQLGHMAQRAYSEPLPTWSPSHSSYHTRGSAAHAMTREEVGEMVQAFAAAAARSVAAGMDGVELACGHGQLINLFLSPLTNTRTDEYGGDGPGRIRFALEVIRAVRAALGPDHILGVRINGDDQVTGSIDTAGWQQIATELAASNAIDYINVSVNFHESVVPTMYEPQGVYVGWASAIRERVDVPVFCVGRITDPDYARQIVEDGRADAVGMTRAHIADPQLVKKYASGRQDDIRPCVGCVQTCIGNVQDGRPITCIFNPEAGREAGFEGVVNADGATVVVVGGGPGGMEAARAAADAGAKVVLFEQDELLGGAGRRYTAAIEGRSEFLRGLAWQERQVQAAGIELRLSTRAGIREVLAAKPDLVIVATGAEDYLPDFAADHPRVVGSREALRRAEVRGEVLLIDGDHHGQALFLASQLVRRGSGVAVVSVEPAIGGFLERNMRDALLRRMDKDVTYRNLERWVGLNDSGERPVAELEHVSTLSLTHRAVDWIVATGARSCSQLAEELAGSVPVVVVGDALAPRRIESAVHEGWQAVQSHFSVRPEIAA